MDAQRQIYSDCTCLSQPKGGLRPQAQTMTRLTWVLNFRNRSRSMIQRHVWEGETATKSYVGLFLDEHRIINTYNAKLGVDAWTVDELSITFDEDFVARVNEWKKLEEIRAYVHTTELSSVLSRLATEKPHPAIVTPLTIFAFQFDRAMQEEMQALVDRIRAQPSGLQFGSDFSTGCYESGFCSAEFSSCTDCDETIDIFDWGFDDGGAGGGGGGGRGGGGGGGGGGGEFDCLGLYWDLVQGCYDAYGACERRKNAVLDPSKAKGIRSLTGQMIVPSELHPHQRTQEIDLAYDLDCFAGLKRCMWAAVQAYRLCKQGTYPPSG